MHRITTIVGARPQFIKAAPVSKAMREHGGLVESLVHTGQHSDDAMSARFFRDFGMEAPAVNLGISGTGHGDMTGRMLMAIEALLLANRPDAVLVYGDTNSTLAGALAAAKLNIPVVHVEAGLRSRNRRMPEEINRVMTDHVSSLLLCPTLSAVQNLQAEGIRSGVEWIGDVMLDVALQSIGSGEEARAFLRAHGLEAGRYIVATIHRAENTDDERRLRDVLSYVDRQSAGLRVMLPLHPRLRDRADLITQLCPRASIIAPLGYFETQFLISQAACVLTDSGGLQKEAMFHRTPCVTLRDETEWTETIEAGWNRLWTVPDYNPQTDIQAFGEGQASVKAVSAITSYLMVGGS
jgi:UDP-GlcNAc3NAcA epimerase